VDVALVKQGRLDAEGDRDTSVRRRLLRCGISIRPMSGSGSSATEAVETARSFRSKPRTAIPARVRAISNRTADAASVAVQPSSRSTTKSRLHESLLDFPECREPDLTSARWKVGVE